VIDTVQSAGHKTTLKWELGTYKPFILHPPLFDRMTDLDKLRRILLLIKLGYIIELDCNRKMLQPQLICLKTALV